MRSISVSTDTFARIWQLRAPGEESEEAILRRVLQERESDGSSAPEVVKMRSSLGKIRWVDDVVEALHRLGGEGPLDEIYRATRQLRRSGQRSEPPETEATIRRTLEDHSSDSANFRGKNLFKLVGRGRWALR